MFKNRIIQLIEISNLKQKYTLLNWKNFFDFKNVNYIII